MLCKVAPRFCGLTRYGTHTARRTGATLHLTEGWAVRTVMGVGGWQDEQEFGKYVGGMMGVMQVQAAANARS